MPKVYSLTIRNRAAAALFALGILGVGAVLFMVGFAILATLAVAGAVLGTGFALYHRLRGSRPGLARHAAHDMRGSDLDPVLESALDPALEVKPVRPGTVRAIDGAASAPTDSERDD